MIVYSTNIVRIVETAAAAALAVVLAPVMLTISLLILVEDGWPVLYRQKRVGKNGKPFTILKFRTMIRESAGPSLTASGDLRVTAIGRRLRQCKLDELPQLFNVLRGDMSLIGPRPEVPEYVQLEDPLWQAVLQVPPGITDLASLAFRDEEQLLGRLGEPAEYYRSVILPAKLRLNLRYLRSRSLRTDLKLLLLTARYSLVAHDFDRDRIVRALTPRAQRPGWNLRCHLDPARLSDPLAGHLGKR